MLSTTDLLQMAVDAYAAKGDVPRAYTFAWFELQKSLLAVGQTDSISLIGDKEAAGPSRAPFEQVISLAATGKTAATWNDVLGAIDASKKSSAADAILLRAVVEAAGPPAMEAYKNYMQSLARNDKSASAGALFARGRPTGRVDQQINATSALKKALPEPAVRAMFSLPDVGRLQRALRPGELVVAPGKAGDKIVIFTLGPSGQPKLFVSNISYSDLRQDIEALKSSVLPVAYDPATVRMSQDRLARVYQALIEPAAADILAARHILWSPDTLFASIPVAALRAKTPIPVPFEEPTVYLGLAKAISFVPKLSALAAMRESGSIQMRAPSLAIGLSDFGSAREPKFAARASNSATMDASGKALAALPRADGTLSTFASLTGAKTLMNATATIDGLKAFSGSNVNILLFYTHGEGGTRPGLHLAPDPSHPDGVLQPADIAGLNFRPRYVLLAACSTGQSSGEGVSPFGGLVQTFLALGARGVLSAQSRVNPDATATLIGELTRGMVANVGPSEALRQALRKLADQPGFVDPIFWSPYVWVGDDG